MFRVHFSNHWNLFMEQQNEIDVIFRPVTGTALAVASGLSFFFLCMILPLVGPAGSRVEHAGQNKVVFLLLDDRGVFANLHHNTRQWY